MISHSLKVGRFYSRSTIIVLKINYVLGRYESYYRHQNIFKKSKLHYKPYRLDGNFMKPWFVTQMVMLCSLWKVMVGSIELAETTVMFNLLIYLELLRLVFSHDEVLVTLFVIFIMVVLFLGFFGLTARVIMLFMS